ncbi:putative bifunctional diguanylate cyclase/phosphodiesterase [Sphingomonas sp. UNC305MFCol5.2]|uniref:putative bifunctional diguanylate cyclase/phosphodiesterase n=1 Tax=Sphingomonas sp. UNC305MFCol5.2 TaxID=1449076 RepID=UPI0004A73FBC|nr:bifunctional diguanylate cyclase/phosphodiesterase [Sphingomonas sp. UNC305MFCol5.2]
MIDVAMCIGRDHDPWLVLLAVFVCCTGAFAIMQMFGRAQVTHGAHRIAWLFLTAVGAGATIWCTHFVAMLAYRAGVPVRLDPVLTIVSLIAAIIGTGVGFGIAVSRRGRLYSVVGGGVVGLAISGMHFTGMAAYRVDGLVEWRIPYVAASVLCSVVFAGAALGVFTSPRIGRHRVAAGTALLVTAIATLHFVAMTALRITPLRLSTAPLEPQQMHALALATALVGLVVITAGVSAALIDRWTRSDAMDRLHHMAMNDALTGLPNRVNFQLELKHQLEIARANGGQLGVVAIDLNHFKEINDVHGHQAGDQVLLLVAQRMASQLGRNEMIARFGGDEFVALICFEHRAQLTAFTDRLKTVLETPLALGQFEARVGASFGVAVYPTDAGDAETLMNNADLAMYRAKTQRSPAPCYYDAPLDEAIRDRRELANDLRIALDQGALELHYQVQTSVATHAVTGYEALLRWTHPIRGSIAPSLFIPIAEENGLILSLGEWVLRRACSDAIGWPHDAKVAINVSPMQLIHADLPRLFHQVLIDTGLPPRRLEIELTETAIIADRDRALHVLRQIKAMGIGVALDDFGTGYSSLETLRAFPFDKIKLDRLFVSELEHSPQAVAIVRAVLALGKSLAIPVLAEGIETERQLGVLQREGCDEVQGFLLGYPQALAEYDRPGQIDEPSEADAA